MVQQAIVPESTRMTVEPLGSPRHLTWLLLRDPKSLHQQEQVRERQAEQLDSWLQECLNSGIPDLQTFAEGLKRAYSAMNGALTSSFSNGPIEGHINKLKYMKPSMYGRGSFGLLRQRFLQAA